MGIDTEKAVKVLVSLIAALYTWISLLIALGLILATFKSGSIIGIANLFVALLVVYPLYYLLKDGFKPYSFIIDRISNSWLSISIAVFFLVLVLVFSSGNPLIGFLALPLDSISGFMFPVEVFYRDILGRKIAGFLFDFGRLYVEFIWLHLLSQVVAYLLNKTGGKK